MTGKAGRGDKMAAAEEDAQEYAGRQHEDEQYEEEQYEEEQYEEEQYEEEQYEEEQYEEEQQDAHQDPEPASDPHAPEEPEQDSDDDSDVPDYRPDDYVPPRMDFEDDPFLHFTRHLAEREAVITNRWLPRDKRLRYYVPFWTDPQWDPEWPMEVSPDGAMERRMFGDSFSTARPAMLPVDQARFPTQYARRFGIHPDAPEDIVGYSQMTPTHDIQSRLPPPSSNLQNPPERDIDLDEAYQIHAFAGYTTAELEAVGAHNPGLPLSPPDLQADISDEDIDPMLSRDRWSQTLWDDEESPTTAERYGFNCKTWWNIDGSQGEYSMTDDRIWSAVKPVLQMVTRVLRSGHPYWNAVTSLYHLRPVPYDRDPRPFPGKNYVSIWLEEDEEEMYFAAFRLKELEFPSQAAMLSTLRSSIRLAITAGPGATELGHDLWVGKGGISSVILLGATTIWALINPVYSESEKAGFRMQLAVTLLHELGHAVTNAHKYILHDPDRLDACGFLASQEQKTCLRELCDEMFDGGNLGTFFFEDAEYAEEGINLEAQIWGGGLKSLSYVSHQVWSSICALRSWPNRHHEPWLWDQVNEKYSSENDPYSNRLIGEPTPASNTLWPIPLNKMTKFFRQEWWQTQQRFGYQAFRMLPYPTGDDGSAIPTSWELLRATWIGMDDANALGDVLGISLRSKRLASLFSEGWEMLAWFKHDILAGVLRDRTIQAAEGKMFRRQLYYEQLTWQDNLFKMGRLSYAVTENYQLVRQEFEAVLSDQTKSTPDMTSPTATEVLDGITSGLRRAIESMLGFLQVVGRNVQHYLSLIASYHKQRYSERVQIHARYMKELSTGLQTLRPVLTLLQVDGDLNMASNLSDDEQDEPETKVWKKLLGALGDNNQDEWAAILTARDRMDQAVADHRRLLGGLDTIREKFNEMIDILEPDYIEDNPRQDLSRRDAVMALRLQARQSANRLYPAAQAEMSRITDPNVKNLMMTWMNCIEVYVEEQEVRRGEKAREEMTATVMEDFLKAMVRTHIQQLLSSGMLNEEAMPQALRDTVARVRVALGEDTGLQQEQQQEHPQEQPQEEHLAEDMDIQQEQHGEEQEEPKRNRSTADYEEDELRAQSSRRGYTRGLWKYQRRY